MDRRGRSRSRDRDDYYLEDERRAYRPSASSSSSSSYRQFDGRHSQDQSRHDGRGGGGGGSWQHGGNSGGNAGSGAWAPQYCQYSQHSDSHPHQHTQYDSWQPHAQQQSAYSYTNSGSSGSGSGGSGNGSGHPPPPPPITGKPAAPLVSHTGTLLQVASALETDQHKLAGRMKQIQYGRNTIGYDRYTAEVPKNCRKGYNEHPRTPDPYQLQSKRAWDGRIMRWRRELHRWDPPGTVRPEKAAKEGEGGKEEGGGAGGGGGAGEGDGEGEGEGGAMVFVGAQEGGQNETKEGEEGEEEEDEEDVL